MNVARILCDRARMQGKDAVDGMLQYNCEVCGYTVGWLDAMLQSLCLRLCQWSKGIGMRLGMGLGIGISRCSNGESE